MIDEKVLIERSEKDNRIGRTSLFAFMEIVNQLAEEHNNGWIATSERLPDKRDWYLAVFKEPDTDFVLVPMVADYLMGETTTWTTEEGWLLFNLTGVYDYSYHHYFKRLKCIAWKPIAPYMPKGE